MSAHTCCKVAAARCVSGSVASTALLVLIPKCPTCVAAYVALVTGAGISVATAAYLRIGMMALCGVTLALLAGWALQRSGILGRLVQ